MHENIQLNMHIYPQTTNSINLSGDVNRKAWRVVNCSGYLAGAAVCGPLTAQGGVWQADVLNDLWEVQVDLQQQRLTPLTHYTGHNTQMNTVNKSHLNRPESTNTQQLWRTYIADDYRRGCMSNMSSTMKSNWYITMIFCFYHQEFRFRFAWMCQVLWPVNISFLFFTICNPFCPHTLLNVPVVWQIHF